MNARFGIQVIMADEEGLPEAVKKSDIITTVTLASQPIVKGEWIKKGALMLNMADFEFTYDCVRMADKIVVDTWNNIKHRKISTVALMYADGLIKDEDITAYLGVTVNYWAE